MSFHAFLFMNAIIIGYVRMTTQSALLTDRLIMLGKPYGVTRPTVQTPWSRMPRGGWTTVDDGKGNISLTGCVDKASHACIAVVALRMALNHYLFSVSENNSVVSQRYHVYWGMQESDSKRQKSNSCSRCGSRNHTAHACSRDSQVCKGTGKLECYIVHAVLCLYGPGSWRLGNHTLH